MTRRVCLVLVCVAASLAAQPGNPRAGVFEPGGRVWLHAHNCYPEKGR